MLLDAALRRDGARPFLTWYDDATGERIELSVATIANWAAKTANLLVDEHGLDADDVIGLAPASHWLSAVALLGAWTAGVGVDVTGAHAGVSLPGEAAAFMSTVLPQPDLLTMAPATERAVAVVTADRSWTLAELVAEAGDPPARCRVLTVRALDTVDGIVAAVVAPLVADGSAVLVTNPDPTRLAARARTERVTHTSGVALDGVAPLSG